MSRAVEGVEGQHRRRYPSLTRRAAAWLIAAAVSVVGANVAQAQFSMTGCASKITITSATVSGATSTTPTASFRVKWGDDLGSNPDGPTCLSYGPPDGSTFRFYINGVDQTWYFTNTGSDASANGVPLSQGSNNYVATVQGYDTDGNLTTVSSSGSASVDSTPPPPIVLTPSPPSVSLLPAPFVSNYGACAISCFAAVTALSTVPFYSGGEARSVTLAYNSDRATPRPFIHADVETHNGLTPIAYWLEAKLNNTSMTFTNGETRLTFQGASGTQRLVGQFDASAYVTGVYTVSVIVTADYGPNFPNNRLQSKTTSMKLMIVNESNSSVARGWTIAGIQRLYPQADSSYVVTDGTGNAAIFTFAGGTPRTYRAWGDNSVLIPMINGTYQRRYPDSTYAVFIASGLMSATSDRFGNQTWYGYDASSRLNVITDPWRMYNGDRARTLLTYNSWGGLATIAEPGANNSPGGGRITRLTVGGDMRLTAFTDPDGYQRTLSYDGVGRLSTRTERNGAYTTFVYDATSWKLARIEAGPVDVPIPGTGASATTLQTTYTPWQSIGLPRTATFYTPAAATRPGDVRATVVDPEGHATQITVDGYGQPLQITDAVGRTTTVTYVVLAQPSTITHQDGSVDSLLYNDDGQLARVSKAGVSTLVASYGAFGQVASVRQGSRVVSVTLGIRGRSDAVVVYDLAQGYGTGSRTTYTYDARGRMLTEKDPGGHSTTYTYDVRTANVNQRTAPGNRVWSTAFDAIGRDSVSRAPTRAPTTTLYDQMNRVVRISDGVHSGWITHSYGAVFEDSVTDLRYQVFRTQRNPLGWVTSETDPVNPSLRKTYQYNRDGLVVSSTNRRGQSTTVAYDAVHRPLSIGGAGALQAAYSYSTKDTVQVAGNALSLDSAFSGSRGGPSNAVRHWTDSIVTHIAGQRFRVQYVYNQPQWYSDESTLLAGVRISTSNGVTFKERSFRYNMRTGDADTLLVGDAYVRRVRNGDGIATGINFDGVITQRDSATSQHTIYKSEHIAQPGFNTSPDASMLDRWYGYDANGRVTSYMMRDQFTGGQFANVFSYDQLGQLSATGTAGGLWSNCIAVDTVYGATCNTGFSPTMTPLAYDAAGNMTTMRTGPASYGPGNRIDASPARAYEYDADGNITRVYNNTGSGPALDKRMTWSAEGLLTAVTSGGISIQYAYDASGRLVRKSRNGIVTSYFLWDGRKLLAELTGDAAQLRGEYAYWPSGDLAAVVNPAVDTTAALAHVDMTSSVIGFNTTTGVVCCSGFGAWGENGVTDPTGNRIQWKQYMWEADSTNMYYLHNRWYDPAIGRFVSEDPAGITYDINLYRYAANDPINLIDSDGMCTSDLRDSKGNVVQTNEHEVGAVATGTDGKKYECFCGGWSSTGGSTECLQQQENKAGTPGSGGGGGGGGGGKTGAVVKAVVDAVTYNKEERECAAAAAAYFMTGFMDVMTYYVPMKAVATRYLFAVRGSAAAAKRELVDGLVSPATSGISTLTEGGGGFNLSQLVPLSQVNSRATKMANACSTT
jgi:RHS repeat-associated protein